MGIFPPETLPVLSGLARGYAVCDHWFGSVPTETMPNRAFACAATSQGHMDDKTSSYTCPSIFGLLSKHKINWAIYGYDTDPLTRQNFTDITNATDSHFGIFTDFTTAAAAGKLPAFTFLEPSWGATGNSQHPNNNVTLGEDLIHKVYYALRNGPAWNSTLLIITYDEHGGCYDHVAPPLGASCRRMILLVNSVSISNASARACRLCWSRRTSPRARSFASSCQGDAAGPHIHPQDRGAPLEPAGAYRPGCGRIGPRRRADTLDGAH